MFKSLELTRTHRVTFQSKIKRKYIKMNNILRKENNARKLFCDITTTTINHFFANFVNNNAHFLKIYKYNMYFIGFSSVLYTVYI